MMEKMMIFSLLMITINGIAAISTEKSPQLIVNLNHTDTDFGYQNRIKRETYNGVTLIGDQAYIEGGASDKPSEPLFPTSETFYYNRFMITRDLGFTSWDSFLSNYQYVEFPDDIHVQFSRRDGQRKKFDTWIRPERIDMHRIRISYENIKKSVDNQVTFVTKVSSVRSSQATAKNSRDLPFYIYSEKIFDESIMAIISRNHLVIWVSLDGFKKDNNLVLEVIYKVILSSELTNRRADVRLDIPNEIVLK